MKRRYDHRNYDPPAPVLDVLLSRPGVGNARISSPALLDTGADLSVIAYGIAARLGLPLVGRRFVAGVGGEPQSVPVWRVDLASSVSPQLEIDAVEIGPTTILGRDVLNRLSIGLHGPTTTLTIFPA